MARVACPNGHTLVNLRSRWSKLDRGGREVFNYSSQSGIIVSAGKTRTGQTVIIEYQG